MKIAYDSQIFGIQSYGGISRYYKILAEELSNQNQDVRIFAGFHLNNYLEDLPKGMVKGVKLSKYPPKTIRVFHWLNYVNSQLQIKSWKPDIIHETFFSSKPKVKNDVVRVTSAYDMIHELFSNEFSKNDGTTERKKAAFNRVDHILSISHSTKNDLVNLFGVPEEKISVVHLGVDFSEVTISDKASKRKPYLLYVGLRGGYKNFEGLLKAVGRSTRLRSEFDLVAFGGGAFTASEQQLIKQHGLDNTRVHQVGGDDQVLTQLYAQAEAFIYPSLYEGFGLPPIEAMAAGCPVVSSNTSSMPEVVNHAGEYFNPYEPEEISEAIERVVFSPSRKAELIALGSDNIKNFSWDKCAKETLNIYQKITGKE